MDSNSGWVVQTKSRSGRWWSHWWTVSKLKKHAINAWLDGDTRDTWKHHQQRGEVRCVRCSAEAPDD